MLKMFTANDVFYPAQYGLGVGDIIDIVLVAGGNGAHTTELGILGHNSFFGAYAVAYAGKGSKGAICGYNSSSAPASSGGGGAGGFIPGNPWQGGNGVNAAAGAAFPPAALPNSNAGGARSGNFRIFGSNGGNFGGGSMTHVTYGDGEGGGGYGAGGGISGEYGASGWGGAAGQIVYYSVTLSASDLANGIPVTVGAGGYSINSTYQPVMITESAGNFLSSTYSDCIGQILKPSQCMSPTFSLVDGTVGFCTGGLLDNGGYTGPRQTDFVKFFGVARVDTFANAFPGNFTNNHQYPMYYCNGWYVQCNGTSGGTQVRAWPADKCRAGTVTLADRVSVTYGSSVTPIGFNGTDMIMYLSANSIRRYANWVPTSSTYTTVTLANNLVWYDGNGSSNLSIYSFFIPLGTAGFIPVTFSPMYTTSYGFNTTYYISNYTAGTCVSTTRANVIMWYVAASGYVCYSNLNGILYFTWSIFTTQVGYTSCQIIYVGKESTQSAINFGQAISGFCAAYFILGTKGFSTMLAGGIGLGGAILPGYDNVPGACGGGAGGCCLITW